MKHVQHTQYDLVVVGSGPGGFSAAIAGAQAGLKTALIERHAFVGGNMQIGLNIHGFEDMNGKRVVGAGHGSLSNDVSGPAVLWDRYHYTGLICILPLRLIWAFCKPVRWNC